MTLDCHVHICALVPGHGSLSARLMHSLPFRLLRWRLGLRGADEQTERELERTLAGTIDDADELDAAVVLAFDAVHDRDGSKIDSQTHLYVTNEYVRALCERHPKMLFGASVHPYRRDALQELQRCVDGGAVLMKWLPVVQGMDPSDSKCHAFYEALTHHRLPLLCHTGGEHALPARFPHLADPMLLVPALQRGVTVIMAHCGTRSAPFERDYLPEFMQLARSHENCFGDTSALNLPTRAYAYEQLLADSVVRQKLVHGSDWPILPVPPISLLGMEQTLELLRETNWLRRDICIKRRLGFDDAYWKRAATLLRTDRRGVHPRPRPE